MPTISHYDILEKLGEGGMGVVWKARDTRLERFVALKLLPPSKTADAARRQRFVQEARAASGLNHPRIITIYEIDRENDADFIAMEYVPGKTLDALIPSKGLRVNDALKYAIQIADALAAAHAAGTRILKSATDGTDEVTLVTDALTSQAFAPSRDGVYYVADGGLELRFFSFATRTTRTILPLKRRTNLGLSVSPDGHWLLYAQVDSEPGSDLMLVDNFH